MAKKWKLRWREGGRHCQRTYATRAERDMAKLELARRQEPMPWITFEEFAERWLTEHAALIKGETTVQIDRAVISRYLIPALGTMQLRDLKQPTLLALRSKWAVSPKERGGKPLSPKTVNNLVGLAKSMLSTAVAMELIPKNPWLGVKALPLPEKAFGYWTTEQRDRFLEAAVGEPAFRELVLVATHTGLRRGELKALTRAQLDFRFRQIRVDATYCERLRKRLSRTKNRKVQYVPMSALVLETLRDREGWPADRPVFDPALFGDFNGRLERRCVQYGVRVIRPHDLRHTFASCLVMAGVPLYTVQKLMRHGSFSMTERYAHLAPAHMHEAVEAICAPSVREGDVECGKVLKIQRVAWRSQ